MIGEIGKKIQNLRIQRRITQQGFAKAIGVSIKTVQNWEGGVSEPDLSHALSVAEYFNISMDELLGREFSDDYLIGRLREDDQFKIRSIIRAFYDACMGEEN